MWHYYVNAKTSVGNPWHFGTDPDPRIRTSDERIRMQIWDAQKHTVLWIQIQMRIRNTGKKIIKMSQNRSNQGLSYYFCLMMEGSGDGSVLVTRGPDISLLVKSVRLLSGDSANAVPHYQKLRVRVTHIWGNRRGQPNRSAMARPHPRGTTFLIMVNLHAR